MKRSDTQIPPKWLVRVFGTLVLLAGFALMYGSVSGAAALGWAAVLIFLGGLGMSSFAAIAIYTGNPEWILLDLIVSTW